MAVGIAGGTWEPPRCGSAVPTWPPSPGYGAAWEFLPKRGSESSCWVSALPWGWFFSCWDSTGAAVPHSSSPSCRFGGAFAWERILFQLQERNTSRKQEKSLQLNIYGAGGGERGGFVSVLRRGDCALQVGCSFPSRSLPVCIQSSLCFQVRDGSRFVWLP